MPSIPIANELAPRDKAGFTLFSSALIHVVVIMGIGFTYALGVGAERRTPSIETTLAARQSTEDVSDADRFAQSAQAGGGLADDDRLTSPLPLIPDPVTRTERTATRQQNAREAGIEDEFVYVDLPDSVLVALMREDSESAPVIDRQSQEGAEAMVRSPLAAELDVEFEAGKLVPRQKFISSRTREHKYATYMEAWRARVEQVGNSNYPEEARSRRLSGDLVVDVAINPDGTIQAVDVIRSSGQKILDDAAVRIVMMAAPFDPFPEEILKETDVIHITRTWQFLHNSTLIGN